MYPHFDRSANVMPQVNDFDIGRHIGPIVMPAYYAVTLIRFVAMRFETAGPEFKFDPDFLLRITGIAIGNTIRICCANLFDAELQAFGILGEQENHTELIFRRILKRRVL